ncbi:uncharacterized protein LOC130674369 [Microplitis mediator]|uniref:uncharacterized protein LOC130674369 n=1 Tax=Microplitis mediator TaxID=375433 RepID=UPI002553B939|nr:uncharacterized protein LOC130674369 [Microplitis mediator]
MENLDANYVELSSRIFVPKDWLVGGCKKLLLSLAKKMIDNVVTDQMFILQINRMPTVLVQYQDKNGTYYVFEEVRDQELTDAYKIDVVINKNIISGRNSTGAGTSTSENASTERSDENFNNGVSFDDYVICTYEIYNWTAFYVVPATQVIQTMNPERNIPRAAYQHTSGGVERPSARYDVLRLFAEIGISFLFLMIIVSMIIFVLCKNESLDNLF